MSKAIIITLSGDIPDTELNKAAKVTVDGTEYNGVVNAIIVYTPSESPPLTAVTLEGSNLKVKP